MKRFAILMCAVIFHLTALYAYAVEPKAIRAASEITEVVVYPDRAMTTRNSSLTLEPGSYAVILHSLPASLLDDSVRVEGSGSAKVKIAGVQVNRVFLDQVPNERSRKLEEEIRSLRDKAGAIDARLAGIASQKAFLESIRVGYGERISKDLTAAKPAPAELEQMLKFLGGSLLALANEARGAEAEKAALVARIDALERELDQIQGEGRKESVSVEALLDVTKGGTAMLALSYVVPQASWEPAYDVRLAGEGKQVELTYRALIRQKTGEDWKDARIALSTARPAAGGNPPELHSWRLAFPRYAPPPPAAAPMLYRQKSMAMAEMDSQDEEAFAPEPMRVEAKRTSVLFHLPRKTTVPADGFPHGAVITVDSLPVIPDYLAVPKLSPLVYLKATVTNAASYPLLAGKTGIFLDGNFTGSGFIKEVAPNDTFDLFFGADEGFRVKRDEVKRHKEAGFLGKNRMTYRYRIEIGNFKKEQQTVTVLDQLPVAADEEIKVKLLEAHPQPEVTPDTGRLKWTVPLKPQEKKEITFEFEVEYPKDRDVSGL